MMTDKPNALHIGFRDSRTSVAWHVGKLPGRKQFCIYYVDGSTLMSVGFIRDEQDAVDFIDALNRAIFGGTE